jgi:hypothetical protein
MPDAIHPLTLDLLAWLARRPRSYAEAMEAWRTSCPRLTIWEAALAAGLVEVAGDAVRLTSRGRDMLDRPTAHGA